MLSWVQADGCVYSLEGRCKQTPRSLPVSNCVSQESHDKVLYLRTYGRLLRVRTTTEPPLFQAFLNTDRICVLFYSRLAIQLYWTFWYKDPFITSDAHNGPAMLSSLQPSQYLFYLILQIRRCRLRHSKELKLAALGFTPTLSVKLGFFYVQLTASYPW